MKNLNEVLKSVKETEILELNDVIKLIQEQNITVLEFKKFIYELRKINKKASEKVSNFIFKHLNNIRTGMCLEEMVKMDNDEFFNVYDVDLAKRLKSGIESLSDDVTVTCLEEDMNITKEIEDKISEINSKIEEGVLKPCYNEELERTCEVNEMEKGVYETVVEEKAIDRSTENDTKVEKIIDEVSENLINISYNFEDNSEGEEIEKHVMSICDKIKSDDERIKVDCVIGDIIDKLIDGINCNIIPINILNIALVTNIGLEIKDIIIDKSMITIDDIVIKIEDEFGVHDVMLYNLLELGLALTVPVEDLSNVLDFNPLEFRGLTKIVDYNELSNIRK